MNKEFAMRWVAALRSGQYKQGQYKLRSPSNQFCCLGVAADLLEPEAWTLPDSYSFQFKLLTLSLPDKEREAIELSAVGHRCLTDKNDNGQTFNEIANFIEAEWQTL